MSIQDTTVCGKEFSCYYLYNLFIEKSENIILRLYQTEWYTVDNENNGERRRIMTVQDTLQKLDTQEARN